MMKCKMKCLNTLTYIAAWVLLAATLATTAGTFAAYRASDTGSDTARVAAWDVSISSMVDKVSINGSAANTQTPSDSSYVVKVTNGSEVAMEYTITISTADPLSAGIVFEMNNTRHETDGFKTTFEFPGGVLSSNTASAEGENKLMVTAKLAELNVDVDKRVTVSVNAVQVD